MSGQQQRIVPITPGAVNVLDIGETMTAFKPVASRTRIPGGNRHLRAICRHPVRVDA